MAGVRSRTAGVIWEEVVRGQGGGKRERECNGKICRWSGDSR
jgi:hypothetical protein